MPKKSKISLSRLESFLKAQCDRLRTSMDANVAAEKKVLEKYENVKNGLMERLLEK